jgi:hypothetical protein
MKLAIVIAILIAVCIAVFTSGSHQPGPGSFGTHGYVTAQERIEREESR